MIYKMYQKVTIPQITFINKLKLLFVKGYWIKDEEYQTTYLFVKYLGNKMFVLDEKIKR